MLRPSSRSSWSWSDESAKDRPFTPCIIPSQRSSPRSELPTEKLTLCLFTSACLSFFSRCSHCSEQWRKAIPKSSTAAMAALTRSQIIELGSHATVVQTIISAPIALLSSSSPVPVTMHLIPQWFSNSPDSWSQLHLDSRLGLPQLCLQGQTPLY